MKTNKPGSLQAYSWYRARLNVQLRVELVHAPIGLPIHSRTPEEIAVSIAADFVLMRNN